MYGLVCSYIRERPYIVMYYNFVSVVCQRPSVVLWWEVLDVATGFSDTFMTDSVKFARCQTRDHSYRLLCKFSGEWFSFPSEPKVFFTLFLLSGSNRVLLITIQNTSCRHLQNRYIFKPHIIHSLSPSPHLSLSCSLSLSVSVSLCLSLSDSCASLVVGGPRPKPHSL